MQPKPTQEPSDLDDLIRIGESSRLLGIHPQTLRDYESRGLITAKRTIGGERRFVRREVLELRDNPPELYKRKNPRGEAGSPEAVA